MSRFIGNKAVFAVLLALFLAVSMGGAFVVCTMSMSPLEHLSEWQQSFAAVAQQAGTIFILYFSIFIAFWQVLRVRLVVQQARVTVSRQKDTGRVFDPLRLAFARGVLHTKAY